MTAVMTDLHWLVHQGHVIEFANGVLETAKKPLPKPVKQPKPAKAAAAQPTDAATEAVATAEAATEAGVVTGTDAPESIAAEAAPAAPVAEAAEPAAPTETAPASGETSPAN